MESNEGFIGDFICIMLASVWRLATRIMRQAGMWRDEAEEDSGFAPVAGTLRVASPHGVTGIEYVDARDVAKLIENSDGGGI